MKERTQNQANFLRHIVRINREIVFERLRGCRDNLVVELLLVTIGVILDEPETNEL
jgi:hypothetical protein